MITKWVSHFDPKVTDKYIINRKKIPKTTDPNTKQSIICVRMCMFQITLSLLQIHYVRI